MATNDYRQDQTSEERDQEISRARRYGFQSSLGVEAPVGRLPESNTQRNPWGHIPSSGGRPNYNPDPSATSSYSSGGSRGSSRSGGGGLGGLISRYREGRESSAAGQSSSRNMGRSRREEFGGNVYNVNFGDDTAGNINISGSTVSSGEGGSVASGNVTNVQKGFNSQQAINQGGPPPQGPAAQPSSSRAQNRSRSAQVSAQMSETNQWAAPVGQQPATPPAPNAPQARQEPQRSTPQQLAQAETSQRPRPPASGPIALGAGPQREQLNQGTRQGPDRAGQAWGAANDQSRTVGERTSALGIARRGGYEGPTLAEAESNRGPVALGPAPAQKASKAGARKAPASGGTKKAAAKKATVRQAPAQEPQAEKAKAEPKARATKRTPAPKKEAPTETETQAPEKKTAKKQSSGTKKAATQKPEPPKEETKTEEKPKLPKPTNIRRMEVDGVMTMVGERDGKQVKMDSKTNKWVPHEG